MQKEKNYFIIKLEKTDINCKIAGMEDVRNKLTQKSNMNLIDNQMFDWMGRFISCTVTSLIIFQYFDDRFLRVYRSKAVYNGIQFEVDIQGIQIDFMKPIDVTTIVGNLLDNAVEACEKAKNRHIILKMHPFNGFTYLQISNTYAGEIKWDGKGRPISKKGQGHGIGLENVEKVLKNYNGAMQLIQEDAMFMVKIIFNQP